MILKKKERWILFCNFLKRREGVIFYCFYAYFEFFKNLNTSIFRLRLPLRQMQRLTPGYPTTDSTTPTLPTPLTPTHTGRCYKKIWTEFIQIIQIISFEKKSIIFSISRIESYDENISACVLTIIPAVITQKSFSQFNIKNINFLTKRYGKTETWLQVSPHYN